MKLVWEEIRQEITYKEPAEKDIMAFFAQIAIMIILELEVTISALSAQTLLRIVSGFLDCFWF